jgi:hypothetical protein
MVTAWIGTSVADRVKTLENRTERGVPRDAEEGVTAFRINDDAASHSI